MSHFPKKIIARLAFSMIMLSLFAPLTLAETTPNPEEFSCDGADILQLPNLSVEMGAKNASYIATEIYEPIGGLDQKIKAGGLTISQVFWKFTCVTDKPEGWEQDSDKNWSVTEKPTADGKKIKVSGYVPYEKGCPTNYNECSIVQIIVGQSGTAILKTYVAIIYRWAAGIVGIIAVLVITVSGIQISMDQGSGENMSAAKTRITQSIAGLVILFLSSIILYTINPTFFQ